MKKIEPAIKREDAAAGWNNNNVPASKYFDKTQDKDFMRKNRPQSASMATKSVKFKNTDLRGQGVP